MKFKQSTFKSIPLFDMNDLKHMPDLNRTRWYYRCAVLRKSTADRVRFIPLTREQGRHCWSGGYNRNACVLGDLSTLSTFLRLASDEQMAQMIDCVPVGWQYNLTQTEDGVRDRLIVIVRPMRSEIALYELDWHEAESRRELVTAELAKRGIKAIAAKCGS